MYYEFIVDFRAAVEDAVYDGAGCLGIPKNNLKEEEDIYRATLMSPTSYSFKWLHPDTYQPIRTKQSADDLVFAKRESVPYLV